MSPVHQTLAVPFSTTAGWLGVGIAAATLYFVARCIYLLYFHPLAKYPGPFIGKISELYYAYNWICGDYHTNIERLHRKYGDIVRLAPNELSFGSVESWKDIYSIPTGGKKSFLKTTFYSGPPGKPPAVFTARDPAEHSRQRRTLAHAFSGTALQAQEPIIHKYVDLLIQQLGRLGAPGGKGIDINEAYNWFSFDLIGDLTFSESFDALAKGRTHPWMELVRDAGRVIVLTGIFERAPLLRLLQHKVLPKDIHKRFAEHQMLTGEKTKKRIELGPAEGRQDFFTDILRKGTPPFEEMEQQSLNFIIAGSETTATALAAQTYFLLRSPEALKRLQHNVRSTFKSADEISGQSTAQIPYLIGVIEEGLRLFPPLATSPPRYSPGNIVSGEYIPAGVTVSASPWTTARDPRYWHEPEKFLPERWIGDGYGDNKQAFRPFLLGAHGCLGINLAYVEMRIALARVVFAYDMELHPSSLNVDYVKESSFPILWERPELRVIFTPRKD